MPTSLIVEDNKIFRETLKKALSAYFPSMEVEEAMDSKGVLKKVEEKNFDIIFMDIQLPHENGLDLTKKIKSLYPGITIIIITEYDSMEYRKAASKADADYFFSKTDLKTNEIIKVIELILSDDK